MQYNVQYDIRLANELGVCAAIMWKALCELFDREWALRRITSIAKKDGSQWFLCYPKQMEALTGLSNYQQQGAIAVLSDPKINLVKRTVVSSWLIPNAHAAHFRVNDTKRALLEATLDAGDSLEYLFPKTRHMKKKDLELNELKRTEAESQAAAKKVATNQ
jgi:hypothetical protein